MAHTICTFNVNNLLLHSRFGQAFPGDMSGKSKIEEALAPTFAFLPMNQPGEFDIFAPEMRAPAAKCARRRPAGLAAVFALKKIEDDPAPERIDFRFARFPQVNSELSASDHCPVFF